VSAAAAAPIDAARSRAKVQRLQAALDLSLELLHDVYAGGDWRVYGHPTWEAFCAAELPQLAQLGKGMKPAERAAAVVELRGRGMSLRAIGTPLGLAPNTVRAALADADVQLATVTSIDGSQRAATVEAPARPRLSHIARAVLFIREAGEEGRTVHEVTKRLRISQCAAAALLSRLAHPDDGRLIYLRPAKRGQTGRYVLGLAQ
jgi:hypothetical protein